MNKLLHPLAICISALLVASASSAPAQAASGQPVPTVAIALIVEAVTPTLLKVTLMYTCQPSPDPVGDAGVVVTQSIPLPAEAAGGATLTCDGASHDIEVMVSGGPAFAPGPALATAQACTQLTCGMDARKVTITEAPSPVSPLPPLGVPLGVPLPGVPLGVPLPGRP